MASLTDVRAVLSRAQTTRHELIWSSYAGNIAWDLRSWWDSLVRRGYAPTRPLPEHLTTEPTGEHWSPEYAEKVDGYIGALDTVIAALKPYEAKPWKARRPW